MFPPPIDAVKDATSYRLIEDRGTEVIYTSAEYTEYDLLLRHVEIENQQTLKHTHNIYSSHKYCITCTTCVISYVLCKYENVVVSGTTRSSRSLQGIVDATNESGAVRHGAECFNFYFPQVPSHQKITAE